MEAGELNQLASFRSYIRLDLPSGQRYADMVRNTLTSVCSNDRCVIGLGVALSDVSLEESSHDVFDD